MATRRHRIAGAARRAACLVDAVLVAVTTTVAIFAVALLAAQLADGPATSVITFHQGP